MGPEAWCPYKTKDSPITAHKYTQTHTHVHAHAHTNAHAHAHAPRTRMHKHTHTHTQTHTRTHTVWLSQLFFVLSQSSSVIQIPRLFSFHICLCMSVLCIDMCSLYICVSILNLSPKFSQNIEYNSDPTTVLFLYMSRYICPLHKYVFSIYFCVLSQFIKQVLSKVRV